MKQSPYYSLFTQGVAELKARYNTRTQKIVPDSEFLAFLPIDGSVQKYFDKLGMLVATQQAGTQGKEMLPITLQARLDLNILKSGYFGAGLLSLEMIGNQQRWVFERGEELCVGERLSRTGEFSLAMYPQYSYDATNSEKLQAAAAFAKKALKNKSEEQLLKIPKLNAMARESGAKLMLLDSEDKHLYLVSYRAPSPKSASIMGFVEKKDLIPCKDYSFKEAPDYQRAYMLWHVIESLQVKPLSEGEYLLMQHGRQVGIQKEVGSFKEAMRAFENYKLDKPFFPKKDSRMPYETGFGSKSVDVVFLDTQNGEKSLLFVYERSAYVLSGKAFVHVSLTDLH